MKFNILINNRNLDEYWFYLLTGKEWYHKRCILNPMQMGRLDYYFDRAILYCKTKKLKKHKKVSWKYNAKLLATKEQLQEYKSLLNYINKIITKAYANNILSSKCRKILLSHLRLIQCHLMGKCNSKFNRK